MPGGAYQFLTPDPRRTFPSGDRLIEETTIGGVLGVAGYFGSGGGPLAMAQAGAMAQAQAAQATIGQQGQPLGALAFDASKTDP